MKMAVCDNCHFTRYCSNTSKVWWAMWQPVCCKFLVEFNNGKISKIHQHLPKLWAKLQKYRGPFFDSQCMYVLLAAACLEPWPFTVWARQTQSVYLRPRCSST